MVGRSNHDIGIFALALDVIGGVGDAWGGVSPCRLAQHLVWLEHRQMFQNQMFVGFVGHHEEILVGNDGAKPFVGASDETLACAKDIEKLFGVVILAERPKAATDAAGHDDAIIVHKWYFDGDAIIASLQGYSIFNNSFPFSLK